MSHTREDDLFNPTGSLIGCGTTPPWHISQLLQPESALRSTQSAVSRLGDADGWPLERDNAQPPSSEHEIQQLSNHINPSNLQLFSSPSCRPATATNPFRPGDESTDSNAFYMQYRRIIPGVTVSMRELRNTEAIEDGRAAWKAHRAQETDEIDDRVYHVRHIRGATFSGTLKDDNPDQIPTEAMRYIKEMERKRLAPIRLQQSIQTLRIAANLLKRGSLLTLERSSFVEFGEAVLCIRPGCLHAQGLPPNRYYLQLDGNENPHRYCLTCFERLWGGCYTQGKVAEDVDQDRPSRRRDSVVEATIEQFDGPIEDPMPGLSSSRWAVPEIEGRAPAPAPARTPERSTTAPDMDDSESSPNSVTSDMEWRYPPTSFQRIADMVTAGASLSARDRSILTYWQLVSQRQLEWQTHAWRTRCTRDYYNGVTKDDRGFLHRHAQPCKVQEDVDEDALEADLGLRKRDVYGTDLSDILNKVAQQKR